MAISVPSSPKRFAVPSVFLQLMACLSSLGMPLPIYRQMNPRGIGFPIKESSNDRAGERAEPQTITFPVTGAPIIKIRNINFQQ